MIEELTRAIMDAGSNIFFGKVFQVLVPIDPMLE